MANQCAHCATVAVSLDIQIHIIRHGMDERALEETTNSSFARSRGDCSGIITAVVFRTSETADLASQDKSQMTASTTASIVCLPGKKHSTVTLPSWDCHHAFDLSFSGKNVRMVADKRPRGAQELRTTCTLAKLGNVATPSHDNKRHYPGCYTPPVRWQCPPPPLK